MVYLFLMFGTPGSGKSFVSDWLARKYGAVHIRSDDLRLYMFSDDRLELHRKPQYREPVAGAMRYMIEQTLDAGHSAIFDANMNNRRETRDSWRKTAAQKGAQAIIIHVQTPLDTAKKRVVNRAEQGGHQFFEIDFVERMAKSMQMPWSNEPTILLDGLQSAEEQQAAFAQQLAKLAAVHTK
ncbi:MAG: ATP-binding protein [Candidatus Saccharimonadales bacterium]